MNGEDSMPRPKAEKQDAQAGLVAGIAAVLAALVVIGLLGGMVALHGIGRHSDGSASSAEERFQHGVQATTDVERAWVEIDRGDGGAPGTYAWINRPSGIVQVPIGRAIDLICAAPGADPGNRSLEGGPR
jgi:hypothetical protein